MNVMYNFRRAKNVDICFLVDLLKELTALEEDFIFDEDKHRRGLKLLMGTSGDLACVLVAEYNGKVIGMCSGQVVLSTAMGGKSIWVEDVVVSVEHRGEGVGKGLLSELKVWAEKVGAKRLQLWADKDNIPAIEFYKHNGWHTANGIVLKNLL